MKVQRYKLHLLYHMLPAWGLLGFLVCEQWGKA